MKVSNIALEVEKLSIDVDAVSQDKLAQFRKDGANAVTDYISKFHSGDDIDDALASLVIASLQEIQVRDFALGLMGTGLTCQALERLAFISPKSHLSPIHSLLAISYYEDGKTNQALLTLDKVESEYSLALLLRRVISANWPPSEFARMRAELHPKVVEGIFPA